MLKMTTPIRAPLRTNVATYADLDTIWKSHWATRITRVS
jgi:hypothetical protein